MDVQKGHCPKFESSSTAETCYMELSVRSDSKNTWSSSPVNTRHLCDVFLHRVEMLRDWTFWQLKKIGMIFLFGGRRVLGAGKF